MADNYEINEKDIESVIRWLKIHDPARATREDAIAMLQDLQTGFHRMSHSSPELLLKLKQELDGDKPSQA